MIYGGCASVSGIFTLCQIRVSVHMHACVQGCVFGSSFEEVSKQEGVCVCVLTQAREYSWESSYLGSSSEGPPPSPQPRSRLCRMNAICPDFMRSDDLEVSATAAPLLHHTEILRLPQQAAGRV